MKPELRLLFSLSLLVGVLAGRAQTTSADGGAPDDTVKLDTVVVTGSNLGLGATAGQDSNLRVLTSLEVEHSGVNTVRDLFRTIPEFGAGGTSENRVNTSSPGTAAVSLRGLGVNSTLVLFNGRRVTIAPFGQGGSAAGMGTESFVDLNQIPMAAIERVEVLKDGGGAIYGADAVGGVVNIILKDRAEGLTVTAGYNDYVGIAEAPTYRASLVGGGITDKSSLTITADFMRREDIKFYDLFNTTAALMVAGTNPGTFVVPVGGIDPITGLVIPAGTAAAARTFTVERTPDGAPKFNRTVATQNTFNANAAIRPQSDVKRLGTVINYKYKLSDRLNFFSEAGYSYTTQVEGLGPASISSLNRLVLPATNPFNPFGVDIVSGGSTAQTIWYRFTEVGDNLAETVNRMKRLVAGFDGRIGSTWTWEASATYNSAQSHNTRLQSGLLVSAVQAALNDTNPATALNLFTHGAVVNNPETLAKLEGFATRDARTALKALDFKTSGPVFDVPAGSVSLAVGGQFRTEEFSDVRSPGEVLGRSPPGPPVSGDREVAAAFVETEVPVTSATQAIPGLHHLSLNVAARYEKFSENAIDDTVVPKVALRWQPLDEQITLRGSWNKGFRAPSLFELYLPQTIASGFNITDPLRFGKPGSNINDGNSGPRQTVSGGNPNLTPEKSESYNFGLRFEPKFLPRFSVSLDYYEIEVENRIGQPAAVQTILLNPDLFPGAVIRAEPTPSDIANNLPGELIQIRTTLGNYDRATAEGFDLAFDYRIPTPRWGTFTTRAAFTYVKSRQLTGIETAGSYDVPRVLGDLSGTWRYRKLLTTLGFNFIGKFTDVAPATNKVEEQVITRLEFTYDFGYGIQASLGSYNLLDETPPRTLWSTGYNERVSYYMPRSVYLNLTKKF